MTVTVANNYNLRKQIQVSTKTKTEKLLKPTIRKTKQMRNKIEEEEDDETMIGLLQKTYFIKKLLLFFFLALSSSKLNIAANIPIAPMSPQLQNVRSSLLLSQQPTSSTTNESKSSTQVKKSIHTSPTSTHRSQRMSITTTNMTNYHHNRPRQINPDSSAANSSSTSPINLSRSISPAASIANFIRPISPPCIQVKEPLSPKFSRASSTIVTNRHCSPPPRSIPVPSIANNIDASTASATTTLLIDDSSGYDSSENQNNNRTNNSNPISSVISTVPESCFEPETYRNLHTFNSNQQKKLSLSDPTLNQTTKLQRRSQPQTTTITTSSSPPPSVVTIPPPLPTTNSHLSTSSLQKQISKDEEDDDRDIHTDDDIENLNEYEDTLPKEKLTTNENRSRKVKYSIRMRIHKYNIFIFYRDIQVHDIE